MDSRIHRVPYPELALIAAIARNRTIGDAGKLPWHIPEDLRHFRTLTMGHRVIMGRKTWASLGKPLPGRDNVVLTRQPKALAASLPAEVQVVTSLEAALALPPRPGFAPTPVFVIGGGEIYAAALPLARHLYLTEIEVEVPGDTQFPEWPREAFREVSRRAGQAASADLPAYHFVHYERR